MKNNPLEIIQELLNLKKWKLSFKKLDSGFEINS